MFFVNVEVLFVYESVFGVKNSKICIYWSSGKNFVFGKSGSSGEFFNQSYNMLYLQNSI